jgi:hypothetical protein
MRPIGPSHNWCLLSTVANIEPVTRERLDVIRALAILILSCVTTPSVVAQSYPAQPIKVIASTSAGDITHLAAHEMSCRADLKLVFVPA